MGETVQSIGGGKGRSSLGIIEGVRHWGGSLWQRERDSSADKLKGCADESPTGERGKKL